MLFLISDTLQILFSSIPLGNSFHSSSTFDCYFYFSKSFEHFWVKMDCKHWRSLGCIVAHIKLCTFYEIIFKDSVSRHWMYFTPLTTNRSVMLSQYQWIHCMRQDEDCVQGTSFSETNIRPCLWCVGVQPFSVTWRLLCYSNVRQERVSGEKMEERNRQSFQYDCWF